MQVQKRLGKLLKSRHITSRISLKNRKDNLLSFLSMFALGISIGILVLIICSIVSNGYNALITTKILLPIHISHHNINKAQLRGHCIKYIHNSLEKMFTSIIDLNNVKNKKDLYNIVSNTAHYELANFITKYPHKSNFQIWLHLSSDFINKSTKDNKIYSKILDKLTNENKIKKSFNLALFSKADSKSPENSGIIGSLIGSLFTIIVCLVIALPVGIMSGICLHELIPQNKISSIIEISINNLASVPSIIFGVLGLTVYLNIFNIPRASSLAGGMTLSLMMLPNLIITTKQAFTAIPTSVKDAAFSLGSSNMQVIMHHLFPIALPTIIQGTIISIARIIGESSPLIMIGMVAFIVDLPQNFLDPTTTLPVQIYTWSNNSSTEFVKLSAIAIIALLLILLILNSIASFIKKKFDHFIF
ncbi:phosphate ABC transporter permease PstA [Candidatus Neoehrlichia procyonis]|uniref:phosphate ABC transporter permease PstA n=1 Tax=Candidatus Neoehrlichia procyonis TaxID=467750 RepID=UPI0005F804FD|nr:phosphate ABC transporter permease PstA [Candidatus Neoehrlichia lotoris]